MTDTTHAPRTVDGEKKGKQVMIAETLTKMKACEEAVKWSRGKTLAECWAACDRPDWMLWLIRKIGVADKRRYRLAACRFVRSTPLADGRTVWDLLTDPRSRRAVEVAEQYANKAASSDDLHAAWDAAHAAVRSASRSAGYAARDAAWAVRAAAWAAWDAASAAAWAAAWAAAQDAGRNAAWAAAWSAAHAASCAAWNSAWPAAWNAAWPAQCKMIRDMWSLEEVEAAWAKKAGKS